MFTLERLIEECRAALQEHAPHAAVREVLAKSVAAPQEIFAAFGEPLRAELVPLHRSPELTILRLVWAPDMQVSPHDHRMWAVIGIYSGREENSFYRRAAVGVDGVNDRALEAGRAMGLGRDVIHAVHNPLGKFTSALHVYGGDFFARERSEWNPKTGEERLTNGQRTLELFEEAGRKRAAKES